MSGRPIKRTLRAPRSDGTGLVFRSLRGKPLSNTTLSKLILKLGLAAWVPVELPGVRTSRMRSRQSSEMHWQARRSRHARPAPDIHRGGRRPSWSWSAMNAAAASKVFLIIGA